MINFTDHLNTLIASNQPEKALEELRKALRDFKISHPDEGEEIAELEQQIILHSARLRNLDNKERNLQLSSSEIDVARSRMFSALLGIISSMGEYPELKTFLSGVTPPKVEASAPAKSKPAPVHAGVSAQKTSTSHSQSISSAPGQSQKSSNGTLLGVLGTVAVIAVAVLVFILTDKGEVASDIPQGPIISSITPPSPEPVDVQEVTDASVWEETKSLGTVVAFDKYLEAYPQGEFVTEAKRLKADIEKVAKEAEEDLWKIATEVNTVDGYNYYLRTTKLGTYNQEAEAARNKIEEGESEVNRFAALQSSAEADTLDIHEHLALWKSAGDNFSGDHLEQIQSKVAEYTGLLASNASIADEGNFVTCRTVSDSKNPIEPGTDFSGSSVYYWARVNAPKSESLSVKWLDSEGKEVGSRDHSVLANTGLGYRIYSQMKFESAGTYEVRLYNSADVLIARRVFRVKD